MYISIVCFCFFVLSTFVVNKRYIKMRHLSSQALELLQQYDL